MISKWYVPGTISLLGILPLFLWKSFPIQKRFDERTLNIYLPKEGDRGAEVLEFSEGMILREVRRKKQTAFYLNDFLEQREDVLESIQQTAREIKFGYDTSRVVKVVYGNKCTFNDFVSVFNICLIDKHKRWAWVQDSIFIFAPDPPQENGNFIGCAIIYENYIEAKSFNWYEEPIRVIAENKLLILGYLTVVIATLWDIRKRFNLKKKE